jgi:hypothetical protein
MSISASGRRALSIAEQLSVRLSIPFRDAGRDEVAPFGGGSSFDGLTFAGRASAMKVNERWRQFQNNRLFRRLVSDEELLSLSERYFGPNEATRELIQPCFLASDFPRQARPHSSRPFIFLATVRARSGTRWPAA